MCCYYDNIAFIEVDMALCKNNCGKEAKGRSMYCSPSCKVAYNRNKTKSIDTNRNMEAGPLQFGRHDEVFIDDNDNLASSPRDIATYNHYLANIIIAGQTSYAERAHPEKLNWGPLMSSVELASAGLVANRVPIPGDWDYTGICFGIPGLPISEA